MYCRTSSQNEISDINAEIKIALWRKSLLKKDLNFLKEKCNTKRFLSLKYPKSHLVETIILHEQWMT